MAAAGVKHVHGDLVGDATAFEAQRIPDGWLRRYLESGYAARVSALSLNDNLMWVAVAPGVAGKTASVGLEPLSSAVPITNMVRTVAGSSGASVSVHSNPDGSVVARGWIGARCRTRLYEAGHRGPSSIYLRGRFATRCHATGVTVDRRKIRVAQTPDGAIKVASLPSPPLARIVAAMNRESINHYAELLFRDAVRGPGRETVGSAGLGAAMLQKFMTDQVGAAGGAVNVSDGGGLSTLDRITPRAMVDLLSYADRSLWSAAFHASLPVVAKDPSCSAIACGKPYAAQGNLHAKTGTTNDVISLGGYVTAMDGEVIAFSFIYNGYDRWNAKSTIDGMGATLRIIRSRLTVRVTAAQTHKRSSYRTHSPVAVVEPAPLDMEIKE